MPTATGASPRPAEQRRWTRLALAIPVFVRGINGQGKKFVEFGTLLNESAGGALLAVRRQIRRGSRVSLEIPSSPLLMDIKLPRASRTIRAGVVQVTHVNGWNLCGLQFARPLVH